MATVEAVAAAAQSTVEADKPAAALPAVAAVEAATSLVEAAQPAVALSAVPRVLQF